MSKKKRVFCPFCSKKVITKKEGDVLREFCPECKIYFYENPLPVVSAIVVKNREVLLVKRRNPPYKGKWCLPSGFAEIGESIHDAALRELEEETGINGKIIALADVDSARNYFYGDLIFLTFEVEQTGGELRAGDDALEAKYFSIYKTPPLAFKSNTKAIETFIKSKSEYWAILDSFSSSVLLKSPKEYKPNFLSDKLVEVIEQNAGLMAEHWINDVTQNKSTPSYHQQSHEVLRERFIEDAGQYVNWLTGNYDIKIIKEHYHQLGSRRRKEGFKISELLSALSLIRKYIWEFALSQGMWTKTIDIYRTLELDRRMVLFFDKVSYYVCRGYESA